MGRLPGAVLFACTKNAVRSPMAEALLKASHGRSLYVDSVGVETGPLDPFAVAVMAERGIDLSRHNPKTLADRLDTAFDVVICLSPQAHRVAQELARTMAIEVELWPIDDPTEAGGNREARLAAYRAVRDDLARRIADRFGTGP